MKLSEVVDPETATAYKVGRRINSISNELTILTNGAAEIVMKIDELLFDEKLKSALGQDTEIDLGCLKATLLRLGDELIQANKKI